jgi:hypothetical protein
MLFEVGVEKGFYAKVSRLGDQWFELDLVSRLLLLAVFPAIVRKASSHTVFVFF